MFTKPQAQSDKPDAYINIEVILPDGTTAKLRKGVALNLDNRTERSLINKAATDPDFEFKLVGKVHIVEDDSEQPDIEF